MKSSTFPNLDLLTAALAEDADAIQIVEKFGCDATTTPEAGVKQLVATWEQGILASIKGEGEK